MLHHAVGKQGARASKDAPPTRPLFSFALRCAACFQVCQRVFFFFSPLCLFFFLDQFQKNLPIAAKFQKTNMLCVE